MAQNTAFVQGFFKGISSTDSYRNLLTSLYYVYKAMEEDVLDNILPYNRKYPLAKIIVIIIVCCCNFASN